MSARRASLSTQAADLLLYAGKFCIVGSEYLRLVFDQPEQAVNGPYQRVEVDDELSDALDGIAPLIAEQTARLDALEERTRLLQDRSKVRFLSHGSHATDGGAR